MFKKLIIAGTAMLALSGCGGGAEEASPATAAPQPVAATTEAPEVTAEEATETATPTETVEPIEDAPEPEPEDGAGLLAELTQMSEADFKDFAREGMSEADEDELCANYLAGDTNGAYFVTALLMSDAFSEDADMDYSQEELQDLSVWAEEVFVEKCEDQINASIAEQEERAALSASEGLQVDDQGNWTNMPETINGYTKEAWFNELSNGDVWQICSDYYNTFELTPANEDSSILEQDAGVVWATDWVLDNCGSYEDY